MQENQFQKVLLPGEELNLKSLIGKSQISDLKLSSSFKVMPDQNLVVSSQIGGKLYTKEIEDKFIVFALNKPLRYMPEVDDLVIGIVKFKSGENYILDINGINDCHLSIYNFPGATKRNYPILQPGALVFCKVETIPKYLPIQLSCLSGASTKHFSTNQNELGELKNGVLCNSTKINTINEMDKICQIAHQVIDKIEIAVGKNFRIWIDSKGKLSKEALVGMKGVIESQESINNMLNKMDNIKKALLAMK